MGKVKTLLPKVPYAPKLVTVVCICVSVECSGNVLIIVLFMQLLGVHLLVYTILCICAFSLCFSLTGSHAGQGGLEHMQLGTALNSCFFLHLPIGMHPAA